MRIRIVFSLTNKGAIAPFHHQHILAEVLTRANGAELPANFCFSCLKGQTKVTSLGLSFLSNKLSLVICSGNKTELDTLLKGLFALKQFEIGQLVLETESLAMEEEPRHEEKSRYVCLSPLVVMNGKGQESKQFVAPDTDAFSDYLYESTMVRMEQSGQFNNEQIASYFRFQVVPDPEYMSKMKREEKKYARIYEIIQEDKSLEVRGYTFPFTLYAHPDVQSFLFDNGLGEHTSQGFGMIDLAEQQFHNRMVPYFLEGQKPEVQERTFLPRERVA